jgi:hypothetical protein
VRQVAIAVVLVAAAAVLAHYHVAAQTYYPVVRVSSPEGLSYLAVMDGTNERQACGAANDRFLKPFKLMCEKCRIVYARCERELDGLEAQLKNGALVPHPEVDAPGFRMAIIGGADDAAQKACDYIAADMTKRGIRAAACVGANRLPPAR